MFQSTDHIQDFSIGTLLHDPASPRTDQDLCPSQLDHSWLVRTVPSPLWLDSREQRTRGVAAMCEQLL
jgi:hypothetical protein